MEETRLALETSIVGMKILQEAIERKKSGKRKSEAMVRIVSKTIVHGYNKAAVNGYEAKVNSVLDDQIRLFKDAIERNDNENAASLAEAGMILLMTAIEGTATEGRS